MADTVAPLLDKIDTVHYSQQSRVLKVAEDYAFRLLLPRLGRADAEYTARHFVNHYNEHGFVIDAGAAAVYLDVGEQNEPQAAAVVSMEAWLTVNSTIAIGPLHTATEDEDEQEPAPDRSETPRRR